MEDVEQPVIRLIPSVSLSEESLETLVTLVEERAGAGESLLLQIRVDGELGRPSVLLQYDTAPQTDAVRAAALSSPPESPRGSGADAMGWTKSPGASYLGGLGPVD